MVCSFVLLLQTEYFVAAWRFKISLLLVKNLLTAVTVLTRETFSYRWNIFTSLRGRVIRCLYIVNYGMKIINLWFVSCQERPPSMTFDSVAFSIPMETPGKKMGPSTSATTQGASGRPASGTSFQTSSRNLSANGSANWGHFNETASWRLVLVFVYWSRFSFALLSSSIGFHLVCNYARSFFCSFEGPQ